MGSGGPDPGMARAILLALAALCLIQLSEAQRRYTKVIRRYVTNGKTYNRSNNSRNNGRVYYNNNTTNRSNNYGSRNTKKSYSNNRINSRSFNTQPQKVDSRIRTFTNQNVYANYGSRNLPFFILSGGTFYRK